MEATKKEIAELVGIMLGDGCIRTQKYKNKKLYNVKITLNSIDDRQYINYVVNLVEKVIEIRPLVRFRSNENTVDIRTCKIEAYRSFLKMGLEKSPKWGRAKIPTPFLNNKFGALVVRGYFDTDGSVVITNNNGTIYPRLEMKVCPSPMQKQFVDILEKLGFRFGVYQIGNGEVRIQLNGIHQLRKWVTGIGFSNPKHMNKARRMIKLYEKKATAIGRGLASGGKI